MIARIGKGMVIDTKCADFLVGAEKQSMKLGVYYFVRANSNITAQADQLVSRLRSIKKSRGLKTEKVLLVGDIDTLCTAGQIITFLDRVEALTGVTPVVYLENSKGLI
ncbi:GH25 family lysozyme, partial [bacterium]|nr:GH25 family lysozyme [bacterium]